MGDGDTSSGSNSSNCQRDVEDIEDSIFDLKVMFVKDLQACDAKWSLFVAAASSYRYDSQLRPFPPKYCMNKNNCNIEQINQIINETTSFKNILSDVDNDYYDNLDPNVADLLHWVLIDAKDYNLRTTSDEEKDILLRKYSKESYLEPTYMFEICPPKNSPAEEKFLAHKEKFNTKYGFYGDKIDAFYSILHNGIQQHFSKNMQSNEKIFLSTDIKTALKNNPHGATWGGSCCGPLVTCIALCEYIENPEHYMIIERKHQADDELEKYIEIKNSEMIRARYLLFYVKQIELRRITSAMINWINEHRYFLAICCYAMLLASIGFSNNEGGLYLRHLISKKASEYFRAIKKYFVE